MRGANDVISQRELQKPEQVIACDLTVFAPSELEQHLAVCAELFGAAREVRDLPLGYAFRLSEDAAVLSKVADFIRNERRCCPFESYTIRVEPYGGAIWFELTGPEGFKAVIVPD